MSWIKNEQSSIVANAQLQIYARICFAVSDVSTIDMTVHLAWRIYLLRKRGEHPCVVLQGCSIADGDRRVLSLQPSFNISQLATALR